MQKQRQWARAPTKEKENILKGRYTICLNAETETVGGDTDQGERTPGKEK